ncbi:hypothetical protein HanPI659440_Chr17g0667821 [Helianthus annuus]|nr:hypothetical protein HanPI659440_Chr17g0667821 [Helianthus annuus]
MWVSTLNKRDMFRFRMGFGTGWVLDQNESVWIGFGSTRVSARDGFQIATGFRSTRVSAWDGFWIATGFRPTRVSARDGFRIATGFRPTRVSAWDAFRVGTGFSLVSFFVSVWSVFSVSFRIGFNIFSFFFLFRFGFDFLFPFGRFIRFRFVYTFILGQIGGSHICAFVTGELRDGQKSAENLVQLCHWSHGCYGYGVELIRVEAECKEDPEGLALRLAEKGAVSAALEVAESAGLSIELRRELQGRQLVKLLTADPITGGGPAEASRFLSSLRDSKDALPVAMGAMQQLPNLRSKQLLVHFFLKRKDSNLTEPELSRLNLWALGLRVLAVLPLPWQQRCSALHEHPQLIVEVLLMRKQLQSASMVP